MTEFKVHAQEEVVVPPTITHNQSTGALDNLADVKSSGYIMSSQNGGLPREEEYKLDYWGKYEVPPPATSNSDQVIIIDTLVSKYRETVYGKFRSKKRSFGAKFMRNSNKGSPSSAGTEGVDSLSATSSTSLESEGESTSAISVCHAPVKPMCSTDSSDSSDMSITLTQTSPPLTEDSSTSPEDPADQHSSCKQSIIPKTSSATNLPSNARPESSDFDTIPELANLKSTTEFQALSFKTISGSSGTVQSQQKVRLLFSGVNVVVVTDQTEHEHEILRKSIRSIACCAQVSKPHPHHTH